MKNIYNISSNFDFFNSFLFWIDENFAKKQQNLENLNIIFPNKRACREFETRFKNYFQSLKIPKIKAISEITISDFYSFFDENKFTQIIKESNEIKVLSDIDYLFFLSEEIAKSQIFKNLDFSQILNLASSLKNLFDDVIKQEIDIEKIYEIDDSNFSKHRQSTLDFLKEFHIKIQNKLIKENILSQIAWQNYIIKKFASTIEESGLKSNLIITGSTGSVDYSKKLIKAISSQKNGFVVLFGFDKSQEFCDFAKDSQYILQQLIQEINAKKQEIIEIKNEKYRLSSDDRLDFVRKSLISSEKTYIWNELKFNEEILRSDFAQNFQYFQAENEIKEVKIVVNQALKSQKQNKKTAIIVNSNQFAKLLKIEFHNQKIEFHDSRNQDLQNSQFINFLLLLIDLFENDFESATLLAILKHQYLKNSFESEILQKFEIEVLRSQRICDGLIGIQAKIQSCDIEIQEFFNDFYEKIQTLKFYKSEIFFLDFFQNLIQITQKITEKSFVELLENQDGKEEIQEFIDKIQNYKNIKINSNQILEFFKKIFSYISYFQKSNQNALIQIISPIEARLLNFDLIIISSLNDGNFPQIQVDNWLGKKIRNQLGADFVDKKYGQNIYDFCNYLSNKSVILTRCKTENSTISMACAFISRLEILLKKINFSFSNQDKILKNHNLFSKKPVKYAKTQLQDRPKTLATTEISTLISDPYQIYAKKILQLKEIDKIDYQPNYKEFGSFVHKVFEEFIKNQNQENFIENNAKKIFQQFFINQDSKMIWWPKFMNIFNDFARINQEIQAKENFCEIFVTLKIQNIEINAKIDRITLNFDNEIEIFDYKTGQIPAKQEVIFGINPQLAIYALMLKNGAIRNQKLQKIQEENCEINSLNYIKISAFNESEIKIIITKENIEEFLKNVKNGLEEIIQHYQKQDCVYEISKNQKIIHQYSHLERIF